MRRRQNNKRKRGFVPETQEQIESIQSPGPSQQPDVEAVPVSAIQWPPSPTTSLFEYPTTPPLIYPDSEDDFFISSSYRSMLFDDLLYPTYGTESRRNARETCAMTHQAWLPATSVAACLWRSGVSFLISQDDFLIHQCRYEIKETSLDKFKIFPWFQAPTLRFGAVLKDDPLKGPTIEDVIRSFNFFSSKLGSFTDSEINFLTRHLRTMAIPTLWNCLTTLIDVYNAFIKNSSGQLLPSLPRSLSLF
jgi:hypothetical protein